MNDIHLSGVPDMPDVVQGDNIADILTARTQLQDGDVLVVSAKIIAKAEGQVVSISRDDAVARRELIESQSVRALRTHGDHVITETTHGFICVNAGIDWSNAEAVLLPRDSDRTAFKIRERLRATTGFDVAVIIGDTFDRAWRNGETGIALGCSGIQPIVDSRCVVDELASAACLVASPVVVIRGVTNVNIRANAGDVRSDVIRKPAEDLFR